MRVFFTFLVAIIISSAADPRACFADPGLSSLAAKIKALAQRSPQMEKSIVIRTAGGADLFTLNPDLPLTPASIQKLIITSAALTKLGIEHRFNTEVFAEGAPPNIKALYVQAGGDPDFKIEDAWALARDLKLKGVKKIGALFLDESFADGLKKREGQRAYETSATPLAFNFNSLAFIVCPGGKVGAPALIRADPYEYPVEISGVIRTISNGPGAFSIDEDSVRGGGRYKAGGTIGSYRGCERFYRSVHEPLGYFAQTFLRLLRSQGISAPDSFASRRVSAASVSMANHESKALPLILRDMNHFSSNFIAEELIYALADDEPKTREAGLSYLARYARDHGAGDFELDDASGLSRKDRAPARMFADIIERALANSSISEEFMASLPVGGVSGTLKKRDLRSPAWTFRGKTGTLDGVSSVAGVAASGSKRAIVVIIFNRVSSVAEALKLQEDIIKTVGDGL